MAIIEKIQVGGSTYDIGVQGPNISGQIPVNTLPSIPATKLSGTIPEGNLPIIPASKLPSYVDDVIEGYYSGGKFYSDDKKANLIIGEKGKIYVDITTTKGLSYRCTTNDSNTQTYISINGSNNISKNVVANTASSNANAAAANGSVYLNHLEESSVTSSHKISGGGITTVSADASGNIIINTNNPNSDTKVTNTLNTTTKGYITATTTSTTSTGTQIFDTGVYLGTSAGYLHAKTFVGDLSGNASTATNATNATNATTATKLSTTGHNLVGGGITTVTASGSNIVISTPDTNTHYESKNIVGLTASSTTNTTTAIASNGYVYLNHIENSALKSSHKISGSGATTVTADASGNIIISSTDTNTDRSVTSAAYHYTPASDTNSTITKNASSSVSAGWNSTSLVTGITVSRDSKGHVTDVALTSVKMPAKPVTKNIVGLTASSTTNTSAAITTNGIYLNHTVDGDLKSSHKISGSGITTVSADASGNIVISTPNTNTDEKVKNTPNSAAKGYITATTTSTTNTGTQIFDTGVYLGTSAGYLHAKTFVGSLSGNASTATNATTATKLSTTGHNLVGGGITAVSSLNGNIVINTPVSYNSGTKTLVLG